MNLFPLWIIFHLSLASQLFEDLQKKEEKLNYLIAELNIKRSLKTLTDAVTKELNCLKRNQQIVKRSSPTYSKLKEIISKLDKIEQSNIALETEAQNIYLELDTIWDNAISAFELEAKDELKCIKDSLSDINNNIKVTHQSLSVISQKASVALSHAVENTALFLGINCTHLVNYLNELLITEAKNLSKATDDLKEMILNKI